MAAKVGLKYRMGLVVLELVLARYARLVLIK